MSTGQDAGDCTGYGRDVRTEKLLYRMLHVSAARDALHELSIDKAFEREEALRLYRRLLAEADWSYQMAQDQYDWHDGRKQFERLYELQALVDADGAIWRAVAGGRFAAPMPRVVS